ALRRSIKGDKDKSQNAPVTPKSAVAIVPPKKVIRALYDYTARTSQELSFSRGDFFHVIGREEDPDWYEACNPALPDARGLVPVAFFQALGRTERDSAQSEGTGIRPPTANKTPDHDSGYSDASPTSSAMPGQRLSKSGGKSGAMVYGIVMYDFVAERADELNAKAGEAIIVIAQSNPEWFVAKPIGRLGGPGLIPVSFIEIRDMATDRAIANPGDALKQAGVPRVEEWKKMAAEYKNSSITLGKFEAGQQQMEQGLERLSLQQQAESQAGGHSRAQSTQQGARHVSNSASDLYAPIQARIPRYCFAEEKYWFVIEAMLEDGRHWELSRYYEDFYDFQIALLTEFPTEAGNTGPQKRSLPYMPGPVSYVTDAITEGRLHNLDAYVKNLLGQPAYISRCTLVKQFFAPREGDYEMDGDTNGQEYRDSQESRQSRSPTNGDSGEGSRSNLNGGGYGGLPSGPRQASGSGPAGQQQLIKVKMYYGDDLIALRVPRVDTRMDRDAQFKKLQGVIATRLDVSDRDELQLFSLNEQTKKPSNLMSAYDLDSVLGKSDKLLLRAEVMRN
ncbi:hypothetical protein LLEC1_03069, partial [Akanthomyces lecanii]